MGCCESQLVPEELDLKGLYAEKRSTSSELVSFRTSNFVHLTKGNLVDLYEVKAQLGQGAFGKVFHAVSKSTGEERAIKALDKTSLVKEKADRVQREIEILKAVDHPNIVKIVEVIEDSRYIYIVQELCVGGELFERIVKWRQFSEETAAKYMYQILSAVVHCHRLNIVHRDLKPENILFETTSENSILKVIDFGISTKFLHDAPLRKGYGTVGNKQAYYVAPEVLRGEYTEKCDVWSCGVILYILLCRRYSGGLPPFTGKTQPEIRAKVRLGKFSFPSPMWDAVSDQAKDLVSLMLTFDPAARPTAEVAFQHPWFRTTIHCILPPEQVSLSLNHLSRFRSVEKLKAAALHYIAMRLMNTKELEELRTTFYELDGDGDGRLSKEELLKGYEKTALGIANVDEVIKNCDTDKNGLIEYSEFLTATIDWQNKLTHTVVESAFKAFDIDGNGSITKEELKEVLGGEQALDDQVWTELVHEVDTNGDGVVPST